jgi:uncharacterized protein
METIMPKIALIFVSLHVLMMLFLAYRVVGHRRTARIGLGAGGDFELERKIRVHANFVENMPLALLALALLELCGLAPLWLYVFGIVLFVGRVLHAIGLSKKSGTSFGRFYGTLSTWIALLAMAATGLAMGFGVM